MFDQRYWPCVWKCLGQVRPKEKGLGSRSMKANAAKEVSESLGLFYRHGTVQILTLAPAVTKKDQHPQILISYTFYLTLWGEKAMGVGFSVLDTCIHKDSQQRGQCCIYFGLLCAWNYYKTCACRLIPSLQKEFK